MIWICASEMAVREKATRGMAAGELEFFPVAHFDFLLVMGVWQKAHCLAWSGYIEVQLFPLRACD